MLGFIEAVVAVKDISKGSEVRNKHIFPIFVQFFVQNLKKVFCNYGYSPSAYKATGIFLGDLECSLVSVKMTQ